MNINTALSMIQQSGGFKKLVNGEVPFETARDREEAAHAGRMQQETGSSSGMNGVIVAVIGVAMVAILAAAIFIRGGSQINLRKKILRKVVHFTRGRGGSENLTQMAHFLRKLTTFGIFFAIIDLFSVLREKIGKSLVSLFSSHISKQNGCSKTNSKFFDIYLI